MNKGATVAHCFDRESRLQLRPAYTSCVVSGGGFDADVDQIDQRSERKKARSLGRKETARPSQAPDERLLEGLSA